MAVHQVYMMRNAKVIVIAGPTASGKTALAVDLAIEFGGEIVSADSMQVYRYMDIGTAKPSLEERSKVPHHLMDIVDPDEEYTAARYSTDASRAIEEISRRGRLAIVAGGTGLYIRALLGGLFEGPKGDKALRERLTEEARLNGPGSVYSRLKEADPVAAENIHPNNTVRVIRALEVATLTGRPISELQREHAFGSERFDALKIGIHMERADLYRAIDARVESMIRAGLEEETRRLLESGYGTCLKPMGSLGYKEMCGFIKGEYALEEAKGLIKRNTRRYAKRQMTWFRKDGGVVWMKPSDTEGIKELVRRHIN